MKTALCFLLAIAGSLDLQAAPRDLHGKDLNHKDMKDEALDRADLSGANLEWANLTNATMKGANLKDADAQGARFTTADLTGADLRGINLKQATLEDAKFVKANLSGTDVYLAYGFKQDDETIKKTKRMLEDARVDLSILKERNGTITFKEADLRKAKLHGSLDGVDFRRADLRGANLGDTTDADKAKWRGAIYDTSTRWPNGFEYAEAGVVAGGESGEEANEKTSRDESPFDPVGTWMIKVEARGASEEGLLTIAKDHSYKWDYSAKAEPIEGKWKPSGEGNGASAIILLNAEAGGDWLMARESTHPDRPDSAELRKTGGKEQRWAVPVSTAKP